MSQSKNHNFKIQQLEPALVWHHFAALSEIPRCSKNEAQAIAYVKSFAESQGLTYKEDKIGNICLKKGASPGKEELPGVVIQGHLDMVCEKNEGKQHDFSKDPISLIQAGDWLRADDTTLGADNGIGVAMVLAALEDPALEHPPLEGLLTIDEESGLTGAMGLDPSVIEGRILINLDSEEPGSFYIGCAGGVHTSGKYPIIMEPISPGMFGFSLSITGLKGGHSGADIHVGLANALRLGGRILFNLNKTVHLQIAEIKGGTKHNAIPREFFCTFGYKEVHENNDSINIKLKEAVASLAEEIKQEYKFVDPNIHITITDTKLPDKIFIKNFSDSVVRSLLSIPHGVEQMSGTVPGLVETSSSLAAIWTEPEKDILQILTSQRSSIMSSGYAIADRVEAAMQEAGADVVKSNHYPAWTPNPESPLLALCTSVYKKTTGQEPRITAIHAGLECGVIGDKFKDSKKPMEMISFGPEMQDIHSPKERVNIPSVHTTWKLLTAILHNIHQYNKTQ